MSILFAGGEDHEFAYGVGVTVSTTAGNFRAGYGRCGLALTTTGASFVKSMAFPGGPVTSCWVSCRFGVGGGSANWPSASNVRFFGISRSPGNSGLYVGSDSTGASKMHLVKWDGTTQTILATETGNSIPSSGTGETFLAKLDMQIINFGSSGTVNVYVNQTLIITYTGNLVAGGISDLDTLAIGWTNGAIGTYCYFSEMIVANEDTRAFSAVTLVPNALGTTDQWTGTYTDVNESTLSDATVNTVNTVGQLQQYALSDLPAGNFAVKAVVINTRATAPAGSASNSVQLGVTTGGGTNVGSAQAPGTGLTTLTRIMATDPTTGGQWTPATVNGMQMAMQSGA